MNKELQQLRIEKEQKAKRHAPARWPWVVVLLLLIGGGVAYWQYKRNSGLVEVETIRVLVPEPAATAGGETDLVALTATGYIMAHHKIELACKVIGRVAWVGVEMGDKVEKDQVLVKLEDDEYKARAAQQQGDLDSAKARLAELRAGSRPEEIAEMAAQYEQRKMEYESAERSYKRMQEVKGQLSTSKNEIEDAEYLMKARAAQAEFARQQLELMKAGPRKEQIAAQEATVARLEGALAESTIALTNTVIRSPIAASILERNVEVGEFVTTGFVGDRGAKGYVVSIADLSDLLVELDISQNDFAKVSADQPCWITTDAYPDKKYDGKVELISPVANRQKATIQVRVKVQNPDALLKPDMNATVSFLSARSGATAANASASGSARPLIRIPFGAIRNGAVFVLEEGRAIKRAVTTGRTTMGGDVEVKSGLIGGEDLIVHPPEMLADQDRVKMKGH